MFVLLQFWHRVLNCEEIKQLLPKSDNDDSTEVEEYGIDALFNVDVAVAHKDFELQRVLQVRIFSSLILPRLFKQLFIKENGGGNLLEKTSLLLPMLKQLVSNSSPQRFSIPARI